MRNIVVPVDFSATSNNALNYALAYNGNHEARVNMIHCYHPPYDYDISIEPTAASIEEYVRGHLQEKMDKIIETIKSSGEYDNVIIEPELILGMPGKEIIDAARNYRDLIVVGTEGLTGLKKIFGSVTLEVIRRSICPVLTVPDDAEYRPIKKVLFATSLDQEQPDFIEDLSLFVGDPDTELHLLYVSSHEELKEDERASFEKLRLEIEDHVDTDHLHYHIMKGKKVVDGIESLMEEINPDLISLVTHQNIGLKRMIYPGITYKLLQDLSIPLLVFPYRES